MADLDLQKRNYTASRRKFEMSREMSASRSEPAQQSTDSAPASTLPTAPLIRPLAMSFAEVAREYPEFPAIISSAGTITYAQLLSAAVGFATRLRVMGVTRRSLVAINTGDMPSSVAVLLATSLLGCRLITTSEMLAKHKQVTPTHFLRTRDAAGKRGVDFTEIDETWFADLPADPFAVLEGFDIDANPEDPWLLLHTSGTTGKPKFFALSQRIVHDRTQAIAEDFPPLSVTCAMLFNPTSRPFYARAMGALLNGGTLVDSTDAGFWKANGVNTVFCSPSQYLEFLQRDGMAARFDKVEISGAKLDDETARRLAQNFDHIIDVYGASETNKSYTTDVRVTPEGKVQRIGRAFDSVLEVVDSAGTPLPAGQAGHLRVRNSYMVKGYLNNPKATAENFKDGWFWPGDIASIDADGKLDIIGRSDEVISFGGVKIDAQIIDNVFRLTPGVKDGICVRSPREDRREVIGFVVFEDGIEPARCIAAIRENYQAYTGLPCFLGKIHVIDAVPYDENGRPMRAQCAQMAEARIAQKEGRDVLDLSEEGSQ